MYIYTHVENVDSWGKDKEGETKKESKGGGENRNAREAAFSIFVIGQLKSES